jgi:hypothetical protein
LLQGLTGEILHARPLYRVAALPFPQKIRSLAVVGV